MASVFESGSWWLCDCCSAEEGSTEGLPEGWKVLYRDGDTLVIACEECVKENGLSGIE